MRFCSFNYPISGNIGDEIQSLAAEQHLPRIDLRIDRDSLSQAFSPHRKIVIMNGWFTKLADRWPPAPNILPVYFGFHIAPMGSIVRRMTSNESITHFKQHEPIGCRDRGTMELLQGAGVKCFLSKCLTLTFPRRSGEAIASGGRVLMVDVPEYLQRIVPPSLAKDAVRISHEVQDIYGEQVKFAIAERLLEIYRRQARLVITTRLHCALPCLALGVPVIFFRDKSEYRTSVAEEAGLLTYPLESDGIDVNWTPDALDIEAQKASIVAALAEKLLRVDVTLALRR